MAFLNIHCLMILALHVLFAAQSKAFLTPSCGRPAVFRFHAVQTLVLYTKGGDDIPTRVAVLESEQNHTHESLKRIEHQLKTMDTKFEKQLKTIDTKFEKQLEKVDAKIEKGDAEVKEQLKTMGMENKEQFKTMDAKFEKQVEKVDAKIEKVDAKIDKLEKSITNNSILVVFVAVVGVLAGKIDFPSFLELFKQ